MSTSEPQPPRIGIDPLSSFDQLLQARGLSSDQLARVIDLTGMELSYLQEPAPGYTQEGWLDYAVTGAELVAQYDIAHAQLEFPLPEEWWNVYKVSPAELPQVHARFQKLGIPDELAANMFAAWGTYSALEQDAFDQRAEHLPRTRPDEDFLRQIARNQAHNMVKKLESLEGFVATHGIETTREIIDTFGIYNFQRRRSEYLVVQNEAWKDPSVQGKYAVVEARADHVDGLNVPVYFEDANQQALVPYKPGVFIFEANSGNETGAIAKKLGDRERACGREPDFAKFIIYGHGDEPFGITMGVNGESISTEYYAQLGNESDTTILAVNIDSLGPNFEIALNACNVDERVAEGKNIADTMREVHGQPNLRATAKKVSQMHIYDDGHVNFYLDPRLDPRYGSW